MIIRLNPVDLLNFISQWIHAKEAAFQYKFKDKNVQNHPE